MNRDPAKAVGGKAHFVQLSIEVVSKHRWPGMLR
jgi:hypothetical protein